MFWHGVSINSGDRYRTHTRAFDNLEIPFGELGKASFASSPKIPNGAVNCCGILANIFDATSRGPLTE
jgi:hypothetical protein